jgi:hypothetical protein
MSLGTSDGSPWVDPRIEESAGKGTRELRDVLHQQEKTHFRDISTGDESCILNETAPSSVWLSLDEELPTRPRRRISADKHILIALWGIKGLVHVNLLPTQSTSAPNECFRRTQTMDTSAHGQRKGPHRKMVLSSSMPDLRPKRTPHTVETSVHPTSSLLVG